MLNKELQNECSKLTELTTKLSYYENLLNETLPGDWEYEYYQDKIIALSFLIERTWKEIARFSPQN